MALFKKKTQTFGDDLPMPQELQDYYAVENRERGWVAWLLGLLTLVLTVLIALGLFYGGRYAYRKIRGSDNKITVTQQEVQQNDNESKTSDEQDAPVTTPTTPETTSSTTPQTSSTQTNTPSSSTNVAGKQTAVMPQTGPANTIAVVGAVSILGYLAHRRFTTKNL